MERYEHKEIEKKWQEKWHNQETYKTLDQKTGSDNEYLLVEFPYPSGNLHVGHWYAFAVPDIYARFRRMQGKNVLYPIGFDAFGLPAENAAIKHGLNPREWTYANMDKMRAQIGSMGASFDTSREVVTCDPDYYRWTQWLFIQLFEAGLVEQRETQANWCPSCKTVLANEQVVGGKCERCDSDVEKKTMKQWQVKITDYADRLIDDLDDLDWPEEIKLSQKNWIGRSEGAEISFAIKNSDEKIDTSIDVFTTRPDTLFGATYMVLAPEHSLINNEKLKITNWEEIEKYQREAQKKTELERTAEGKEKTGVKLEGVVAINPANDEEIPIYIADYVLTDYGTGAIMAVPAHDQRDFEFAKKYNLEIRQVIATRGSIAGESKHIDGEWIGVVQDFADEWNEHYKNPGKLMNSGKFDGMDSEDAKKAITEKVGGKMTKTYKLRDWGVSRQRYWGVPIPIVHCDKCGSVAVNDDALPVELPEIEDYMPAGDGRSPLAKADEWMNTQCPECGEKAVRETDTLDTFVCSSWYYLRYVDPQNTDVFADNEKMAQWMPVDLYSGGSEHTTMHLLYSRFWHKALYDLKLVADAEPYKRRMNRGLILGPDGNKMSKSKGNVIDPDNIVEQLGADTMRLYLAFIGPFNEVGSYPWNPESIVGVRRFVERVWRLQEKIGKDSVEETDRAIHKAIKGVTDSLAQFKLNTGVATLMTCVNVLEKTESITKEQYETFLTILAPYAPHIAEEIYNVLGNKSSITQVDWPEYDEEKLVDDEIELVVQVNGKVRDKITVPAGITEEDAKEKALASTKIQKYTDGKEIRKVIFIQGKLISIVV